MKNNKTSTINKVLKLTHRLQPGHITLIIISRIINVTSTFIPIVLSSIILDQLISHAPFETIFKTGIILVISSGFLGMVYWGLQHILTVNNSVMAENIDQILNEKTNNRYDFKLRSATLVKESNTCQVEVLYKDGVITKKQFNKYTRERKKQWRRDTREQQIQSAINKFTMLKNGILTKLKQIVHSEQM